MTNTLIKEQNCLEFKADFFPMTVLRLHQSNLDTIKAEIHSALITAPNFFKDAPIVIDISNLSNLQNLNLDAICELLRENQMIPVGIRGIEKETAILSIPETLIIMKAPSSERKKSEPSLTTNNMKPQAKPKTPQPVYNETKHISAPIRAGTQIYARKADLLITSAVNSGGECLADGNIYIYGPLRGKALAGANGNEKAYIFCTVLEAELISIAGHYLTRDQIKVPKNNKPMIQIYLRDGKIQIEGI